MSDAPSESTSAHTSDATAEDGSEHPSVRTLLADALARLATAQAELVETHGRLGQAEGAVAALEARLAATATELERARADADRQRTDADRERGERTTERERADKLAGEVTDIAKKLAELTAAAQPRRQSWAWIAALVGLTAVTSVNLLEARSWWPFQKEHQEEVEPVDQDVLSRDPQ